jgi:sodium-dependent dicarboxylate transporter 2/3/5
MDDQTGIENDAFEEAEIDDSEENKSDESWIEDNEESPKKEDNSRMKNMQSAFLLAIPYSCHVGGVATLTGTAPNLLLNEY